MDTQYRIATALDTRKLEESVLDYLQSGWELQGGPFVANNLVCQALTKTECVQDEEDRVQRYNFIRDGFITNAYKGKEWAYKEATANLRVNIHIIDKAIGSYDGEYLPELFGVWRTDPKDTAISNKRILDMVKELLQGSNRYQ